MWRLIILVALVACDSDPRTSGSVTAENMPAFSNIEELEEAYEAVSECMMRTAHDKPRVVFFEERLPGRPESELGHAWFQSGNIWVRVDSPEWRRTLRHEFIHHILAWTGYPDDKNANHDHPAWFQCE